MEVTVRKLSSIIATCDEVLEKYQADKTKQEIYSLLKDLAVHVVDVKNRTLASHGVGGNG